MNDEYLKLDFTDLTATFVTDRREFLKILGAGLFVFVTVGDEELLAQERRRGGSGQRMPADFNAFLKIGEDGSVSCFTGKIEMGQGVITSLAQMLADELNVPLESVDMVMGDTDLCPWDMGTFGSMSTRFFGPPLRAAAAEARAVLLQLAAERLQTPVEQLSVEDGAIFPKGQKDKRVSFAELTKGKKIERHLKQAAKLEAVSDFTIVGQAGPAQGCRGQSDRQGEIRGRHPPARDALRGDPAAPGPRRDAEERGHLRSRKDRRGARRARPAIWWPCFTSIRTSPNRH